MPLKSKFLAVVNAVLATPFTNFAISPPDEAKSVFLIKLFKAVAMAFPTPANLKLFTKLSAPCTAVLIKFATELPIKSKSVFFINEFRALAIPAPHVVAAVNAVSQSMPPREEFIKLAIELPKFGKLKFSPNPNAALRAVFMPPATVFPKAENNPGEISPFKNSASPEPNPLAFSYMLSQSMLSIASVRVSPIYSPSLYRLSISLSNFFTMLSPCIHLPPDAPPKPSRSLMLGEPLSSSLSLLPFSLKV